MNKLHRIFWPWNSRNYKHTLSGCARSSPLTNSRWWSCSCRFASPWLRRIELWLRKIKPYVLRSSSWKAVNQHLNAAGTKVVHGTYLHGNIPARFHINPNTGLTVVSRMNGRFITGFRASPALINDILVNFKLFWWKVMQLVVKKLKNIFPRWGTS